MAGMQVVPVACDSSGNIDQPILSQKSTNTGDILAALMITYPSTHGVFEESIEEFARESSRRRGDWFTWTAQT